MIEQGILNPFLQTPVGRGITRPKHALVNIGGVSERCIVKNVDHKAIAAECFCALLGDALGLPTLKPVIVTNPQDNSLYFGSRLVPHPSLSAALGISDSINRQQMQALVPILLDWSDIGSVIAFDELILNGDRNPGNVLWNGDAFVIIDHERTLGIQPKCFNKLARITIDCFEAKHIDAVRKSSVSAALTQNASLSADGRIFDSLKKDFSSAPAEVSQYFNELENIAKRMLPLMMEYTLYAMSPLFSR